MEEVNHLKANQRQWFAIYTKFKCEKYVLDQLEKKNIQAYVPLIKRSKKYISRVKVYEVPLINCYVFVKINKEEYVPVLETDYVFKFIKIGRSLVSIPEDEIILLKRVVGDYEVAVYDNSKGYKIGQKVEIISGDLTGVAGTLIEEKNKKEFVVDLINIGIQLQIQIDWSLLRPLVY